MSKLILLLYSVVLVGFCCLPANAQFKSKGGIGGGAFPTDRRVDTLQKDVAKLQDDLETAQKIIKHLQMALDGAQADPGPRYQGWTAPMWLRQFEDLDPKYRLEAIKALGVLARKNQDLIPVLLRSLKDDSDEVGSWGAYALARLGEKVVPALVKVLNDKSSPAAQIHAAYALGTMEPRPKTAAPALTDALKANDWNLREAAVKALGEIGPDARPAMPALTDVFQDYLKKMNSDAKERRDKGVVTPTKRNKGGGGFTEEEIHATAILRSMAKIDPKGTVPSLTLALKEDDWEYLVDSAVQTLSEIGPSAKAALPAMVTAFESSVKELKGEGKSGRGKGPDFSASDRRPVAILRALVKIDPDCRGLFPRAIRDSLPPGNTAVAFGARERVAVEDLEEALETLKKRNAREN